MLCCIHVGTYRLLYKPNEVADLPHISVTQLLCTFEDLYFGLSYYHDLFSLLPSVLYAIYGGLISLKHNIFCSIFFFF